MGSGGSGSFDGPESPVRHRVRAERACSLPTAAIALAAMMGFPATGARQQRHLS